MGLFENNLSPYLTTVEGTTPASPSAGQQRLFVRSSDHVLCRVNSSGVVVPIETASLGLPLGLTGAVSPTRYVGGTASVAPTTGTFAVGDFVTTAAGGIYICTVAGSPGTWAAVSGSAASPLLAVHACVAGDYDSLTATSMTDVDATNMVVTFTAPASTNVLIRLTASAGVGGTALDFMTWGLRESTSNIAGGTAAPIMVRTQLTGSAPFVGASAVFVLTGIGAGSHTYKWSYSVSAGTATGHIRADSAGPAVMEVWAA